MAPDAVVVGAGPNGLAAAIRLARDGSSVLVVEAAGSVGGGCRSGELTLPGFVHDVCSAVHPLAAGSPFLSGLPLARHGLSFVHPDVPLAHPLDDGTAVLLRRSVEDTALGLGPDQSAYRRLMGPLARRWGALSRDVLGPPRIPRHPLTLARFGLRAIRSVRGLSRGTFEGTRARALLAGLGAHSILPLDRTVSGAFGLVLGAAAHAVGWPVARGGSSRIAEAMASYLRALGGSIETDRPIRTIDEVPDAEAVLLDLVPRGVVAVAGDRLPAAYRRRLERYRHGPGVFKLDYALDGPIPWRASACRGAGTVHLGGTLEEIEASEAAVAGGRIAENPFVLLVQASQFDRTRAPAGKHTAWAYCHVPAGCDVDVTARIEAQIERFAPGFRDRLLARSAMGPAALERYNPNYVGGDIAGGAHDGLQLFARPTLSLMPYTTPAEGLYMCSSATPPGAGVHGMCGYHAAGAVLKRTPAPGR